MSVADDLRQRGSIGDFLIVTPAAGATFYIDSRDGRTRYEQFLLQEFLPQIEQRYRTRPGRAFRGIGGISMGGYGALHLAFSHPELFTSVSTHSAALVEKLPAVALQSSAANGRFQIFGNVFGVPFDRTYWDRNNPLTLARTADLKGLKIYFDCGTEDSYGFYAGAEALHNTLTARHIPHEFHLYPGGHTWSYFVEHLPASFEFHSRAFGLGAVPANR
jgi:S-formylglutathione hydrolase FrmB